jgi:hypothetical protein
MATRAEKKRARELVDTLVWDLPDMEPKLGTLPPNPDGLEHCAEFDVLPGLKAVCFPAGDEWRGLLVQFDPGSGQVTSMMEHQARAASDDDATRWALQVIADILTSAAQGAPDAALPRERLIQVAALLARY